MECDHRMSYNVITRLSHLYGECCCPVWDTSERNRWEGKRAAETCTSSKRELPSEHLPSFPTEEQQESPTEKFSHTDPGVSLLVVDLLLPPPQTPSTYYCFTFLSLCTFVAYRMWFIISIWQVATPQHDWKSMNFDSFFAADSLFNVVNESIIDVASPFSTVDSSWDHVRYEYIHLRID